MTILNCPRCREHTEKLVKHHVSYIPEVIEFVCKKCDTLERRNPKNRGFPILKVHPNRGLVFVSQKILSHFGTDLLEIELLPVSPFGVVFPYMTLLADVERSLEIVLEDIKLRRKMEEEQKDK